MTEPISSATNEDSKLSQKDKLLRSRGLILAMLFGVTGFLGIPVLCMSPSFSRTEKVVWSIVVTIYTSVLIAITGGIIWWSLSRIFGW